MPKLGPLLGFELGRGLNFGSTQINICRLCLYIVKYNIVMTSLGQVPLDIYRKALNDVENGIPLKQVVRSYAHTGFKRSSLQRFRKKAATVGNSSAAMGYHKGVPRVLSLEMDTALAEHVVSGVKSILKLYLSKSIVTDGKTTRSKVESID